MAQAPPHTCRSVSDVSEPGLLTRDLAAATRSGPFDHLRDAGVVVLVFLVVPTVGAISEHAGHRVLWLTTLIVAASTLALALPVSARLLALHRPVLPLVAAWVLAVSMLLSLLANSPRVDAGYFWTGAAFVGAALASSVAVMDEGRVVRFVTAPLLGAAALQAVLMAAQTVTGNPFGLRLVEPGVELSVIDGILRPQGTMGHVFEPALFATVALAAAAVCARRIGSHPLWLFLIGVAAGTISLSLSRTALLAAVVLVVGLVLAHRRGTAGARNVAAAIAIGVVAASVFVAPGWMTKAEHSASTNLDELSLGRVTLMRQAIEIIGDHPLIGVGTASYLRVLGEEYEPDPDHPFSVHNASLRLMADLGIPLGLLVTALIIGAGVQAFRAGTLAATAFTAMAPWLVFDINYYDRISGHLLFGVWLGVVAYAVLRGRHASRAIKSS